VFEIKKKPIVLLLAAVLAIGAAGCGADDSEDAPPAPVTTTDTATSMTMDELINEGDDICAEVNAAVGTIDSSTTTDEAIRETQISDIYAGLAERMDGLGTPSDGEAPTDVIEAAQALSESSSTDGAVALETFQTAATDYGFVVCAEAPAAPSSSGSTVTPPSDSSTTPVPVDPTPVPVEPAPVPVDPAPDSGGGVVPDAPAPDSGGGSSSGGISPG